MKYLIYLIKRIGILAVTMLVVSVGVFFLLRSSGVDPLTTIIGTRKVSEEVKQETRAKYNLNKSTWGQYVDWIKGIPKGDWGTSYVTKQPAKDDILARVPVTVGLVLISMVVALIIAIPLGFVCALARNTWIDRLISIILLLFTSTPSFLMALIFLVLIPIIMPGYSVTGSYSTPSEYFARISVPAVVLALFMIALIARVMKSSVIEQLKSNYVTVVKAKGLSTFEIMKRHVMRNSIIPVLTISASMVGSGVGGAVLVEDIFSLPGLGSLLLEGIITHNYPVVQAIVMIMLALFLIISLVVDMLYALIDPRISL